MEKIWIIYDTDKSGELSYDELKKYLKDVAIPSFKMTDAKTKEVFELIDRDHSKSIGKDEMENFLREMIHST